MFQNNALTRSLRNDLPCFFTLIVLPLVFSLTIFLVFLPQNVYAGQATLSWDAPTTNVDGSPLTDLAGYKIYYGTSSSNYSKVVDAGNVLTYVITDLNEGQTYYFAVTAYDTSDNESDYSNEVSKIVNTYSITATAGPNGTISPSGTIVVDHGTSQSFTITPDAGYNIQSVTDNGVDVTGSLSGNSYTVTNVTSDHTILTTFEALPSPPTLHPAE